MIKGIEDNIVCCGATEEKILLAWRNAKSKKISIRDSVKNISIAFSNHKEVMIYRLWNTNLVEKFDDDIYIHISSNQEEVHRYCNSWNYSRRDYIISNTTRDRLNTFLSYYGFDSLEVHSSMKDWSVKYKGRELTIDRWYKLDFEKKDLIMYLSSHSEILED